MTIEEINKDYQILCQKLGDTEYKIKQHLKLKEDLMSQIDDLNKMAAHLNILNAKNMQNIKALKSVKNSKGSNNEPETTN